MCNKNKLYPLKAYLPLIGCFVALLGFAVTANTIPPLISTMGRDLGRSISFFGLLISIQYIFFALASFTGGYLENKLQRGNIKLTLAGLFILGICFFIASGFNSIFLFLIWAAPFGFAGGLVETFSSVIISNHSNDDSSKLLVLSQVFYCVGAYIAPQMVAVLLIYNNNWQSIFRFIGFFIVGIIVLFMLFTAKKFTVFKTNIPNGHQSLNEKQSFCIDRKFLMTAPLLFLYVVAEIISICWVPLFFENKFSLSPASSAWRVALLWAGFVCGRLFILILPRRWTMIPAAFASIIGMILASLLLHFSNEPAASSVIVFGLGFFAGPLWPVIVMLARSIAKNDTFTSCIIGCGALGAAAGPSLGAWIINVISIENIFLPVSFICLAMFVNLCFFNNKYRSNID